MGYVAIKNFKDGEPRDWKYYKVGDSYDGKNAEEFLKHGFLRDAAVVAEELAKKVEDQSKSLGIQAKELKAKADAIRAKNAQSANGKAKAKTEPTADKADGQNEAKA